MSPPPGHVHVSERQTGKWYDCLWMSAVEWLRAVHDSAIPATHAEGDALRAASDDLGPSNFGNLAAGVKLRYGWTLPKLIPAADLWTRLEPGHAAVVSGGLTAWPAGSHWRRWAPTSTADHAAFAMRLDTSDAVWWCDPLAPTGTYQGERMPKAELLRFVAKTGAAQLVAPMLEGVMAPITSETAALIDTPAGAPLYDLDGTTKLTTLSDAFASRTSPYGVGPKRAIFVTIGGVRRVVLVTPTAIRLSSTTGDCTAAARQGWNDARQAAANAAGAAILAAVPMK